MRQRITTFVIGAAVMFGGLVGMATLAPASTVNAADGCNPRFLTFPTWYNGLTDDKCELEKPRIRDDGTGVSRYIFRIVLNIITIALQLVAYAAVGYLIYGGFKYLTSSGSPDKTTAARKTIINAVIGLIISFFSVVIVTLVARNIN